MAEHVTTLLDKLELLATNASDTDKIYVVHGTGSDRDRYMKLSELRKLIGEMAGDITVNSITFTDGTFTYGLELNAAGDILFWTGISCHHLITEENISCNGSIGCNGKFIGNLEGNVQGNTDGTHVGNVKTSEILATTSGGTVAIGRAADTFRFDGNAVFNNTARFDKMALFKGQFVQDIQESELDSNGGLTPSFDITKGSVLYITPQNIGAVLDLYSLLANANYGARYSVLIDQGASDATYIDIGLTGKKWKMTGFCGCDFIVVKQTANDTVLHPVGAGQLVNT